MDGSAKTKDRNICGLIIIGKGKSLIFFSIGDDNTFMLRLENV